MSILDIITAIPAAQQANLTIQQCQNVADVSLSNQSLTATQLINQLDSGMISKDEFQDLMLDLKAQVDANNAAQMEQIKEALSQAINLIMVVASTYI